MKRKIISNTYLRETVKYQIKLFLDEDELIAAYNEGDITKEYYDLVYKVRDKLLDEINNNINWVMNLDYKKYIDNF